MRVVLDTNVWISALVFPGGTCDQLVQQLLYTPKVRLLVSPFILDEFARVASQKLTVPSHEVDRALQIIREVTTLVTPHERLRLIREKDDDNRILECAIAAEADLLVTGDTKHLLPLRQVRGIPIRSPRDVLDQWLV